MTDDGSENEWHLDKRVPLAIIVALIGQTALAGWFASELRSGINENARDIEVLTAVNSDQNARLLAIEIGAARLDEKLSNIATILARMERTLERAIQKPTPSRPDRP